MNYYFLTQEEIEQREKDKQEMVRHWQKLLGPRPGDGDAIGSLLASIWDKERRAFEMGWAYGQEYERTKEEGLAALKVAGE